VSTTDPLAEGRQCVGLDSIGSRANVHINFRNVAQVFRQDLSPRLIDFLEIASYVFSADCATPRGKKWADEDSTEPWGRDLAFVIPVRDPVFWGAAKIKGLIEKVLCFLSNDKYSFTFTQLERDRPAEQHYLQFADEEDWPFHGPERVLMFSGGLDSLAGVVEMARAGANLVLVSHRPVSTLDARQKRLFRELQKQFPGQLIHIPVWINKAESFGREPTQRTRSFLFSALGSLVAQSVQARGLRFYENGIVSLNLPIAQEALRARASRTTHPAALHLLSLLSTEVTARPFVIDNPYVFKTKTEVVASLGVHKAAHLIAHTCSCSRSMFQTKMQPHCGRCSQCIDRRFAVTAADLLAHDSEKGYVCDVFLGPREDNIDRAMAVDCARHGIELDLRSETELATRFSAELSRGVRYEANRREAGRKIISMHKRHGEVVTGVLQQKIRESAARLVDGTLDKTSLLALAIGQQYLGDQPGDLPAARKIGRYAESSSSGVEGKLANIDKTVKAVLARIGGVATERIEKKEKPRPGKRDAVIFGAILKQFKGMKYCAFLQQHGVKPKWSDPGPAAYPTGYQLGEPWRKKVQDEKTRAKQRMEGHDDATLADCFNHYLPIEFQELSGLLHSRNSRRASKNSGPANPHRN
jgi:hypothetical protein